MSSLFDRALSEAFREVLAESVVHRGMSVDEVRKHLAAEVFTESLSRVARREDLAEQAMKTYARGFRICPGCGYELPARRKYCDSACKHRAEVKRQRRG